ncbi:hypothetical protein AAG570_006632 [Ranatra chinensis]|uniref:Uncharacterized protein n=1 Tax=Ranatra chinensis TaxID=642074 RepID=A0ABD0YWN9_9HEMI
MEAAFLATLCSAPGPAPSGRRHSVVTISKVPKSSLLFGRNRRESFAAFPSSSTGPQQRTPSASGGAGSSFNLQLDIMDDIAEIKAARKVKLKMWQNEAEEKVCEVQPMDGGSTSRYHQKDNRRFSDISGMQNQPPQQQQSKRRASELPSTSSAPPKKKGGIVCSNSDLINIMSSLTSSAQEINTDNQQSQQTAPPVVAKPSSLDQKRRLLQSNRSNSFDVSLLPEAAKGGAETTKSPVNWFTRRHLPMANKKYLTSKAEPEQHTSMVTLTDEKPKVSVVQEAKPPLKEKDHKVVWDKPSGSVVDAQVLGSAIEVFLTQRGGETPQEVPAKSPTPAPSSSSSTSSSSWFGKNNKPEVEEDVTCDNSICSTLKDLFVK